MIMGFTEWATNIAILMTLINVVFFVTLPNANSGALACLKELDNSNPSSAKLFSTFANETVPGTCAISFAPAPNSSGGTSNGDLVQSTMAILFKIPIFGDIAKYGIDLLKMFTIAVIFIVQVSFLGWQSIFNALFLTAPVAIRNVFFVIGSLLTLIQFFGILTFLSDFVFKLGRVIPGA